MSRLFNAYVMVDWSAAAAPKQGKDSIWIGVLKRDSRFRFAFEAFNPPTRKAAEAQLREVLADLRRRGDRALMGFDFPLGFPDGTAKALQLKSPDWRGLWSFLGANLVDKADNTNNRFAVAAKMNRLMTGEARPFWGAPPKDVQTWLQATRPVADPTTQLRHGEIATQPLGKGSAKSVWQLMGAGSVGGQALTGIPAVARLMEEQGDKAAVWPFETGWRAPAPDLDGKDVVIAEIYPALVAAKPVAGEIIDRAQVRATAEHFARLDEQGRLAQAFAQPPTATPELVEAVEREEGWILGA